MQRLNEANDSNIKLLAQKEDILDIYAKQLAHNREYEFRRGGKAVLVDPNKAVMDTLAYDCQQKYGFCERPATMMAMVRGYLMPAIQRIAKEKYNYNGPIWPTKDEEKASDKAFNDANEEKLQRVGAAEKIMNDEPTLYWTGFYFGGRKSTANEKREAIRDNIISKLDIYMSPDVFIKTATGKKIIKAAKNFYETHDYDFHTETFRPKQDKIAESRKIQITENDVKMMAEAVVKRIMHEAYRSGYAGNEGNGRIGGKWASGDFIKTILFEPGDFLPDEIYNEAIDNLEVKYSARVKVHWTYDESTGYGDRYNPVYEIEGIIIDPAFENDINQLQIDDEMKQTILDSVEDGIRENPDDFFSRDDMNDE